MSLNRLRRLAGLNESFTDDPKLNADIERNLALLPTGSQPIVMDVLETIYNAGQNGISVDDVVEQVKQLNIHEPTGEYGELKAGVTAIVRHLLTSKRSIFSNKERGGFGDFIEQRNGKFFWKSTRNDMDLDTEVDPQTRAAVGSQVELTSKALEAMRMLTRTSGLFTERDLARYLVNHVNVPKEMAINFANHVIGQFRSMLTKVDGGYALHDETPTTRDDSMKLFRDLEANARKQ